MTRMTLPASRGLGQSTRSSSVQMDRGLEYPRLRTDATTPALVPLLTVASKSEVMMQCLACSLQFITFPSQGIDHSIRNLVFALPASVFATTSGRMVTKGVAPFPAAQITEVHLQLATTNTAVLPTIMKQRQIITIWLSVCGIRTACSGETSREGIPACLCVSGMS